MKKRILPLLLAICMVVGLLPMVALAEDTADHTCTPGEPETTVTTKATTYDATGCYTTVVKCTACGETISSEESSFEPGLFYIKSSGTANYQAIPTADLTIINPGTTKYYVTKKLTTSTALSKYPDGMFMVASDASNWNVKIEYPILGQPTMILKGAQIKNDFGIFYGNPSYKAKAPLKIVVLEDSVVGTLFAGEDTGDYNTIHGALNLHTTAPVTITGPGKLTVSGTDGDTRAAHDNARSIVYCSGDITFENIDLELVKGNKATSPTHAIYTSCGNITFKNTKAYICGLDRSTGGSVNGFYSVLRAIAVDGVGGNIIIEDGSDITVHATSGKDTTLLTSYAVQADTKITIRNSNVDFVLGGATNADGTDGGQVRTTLFNTTPVLEFTETPTIEASTGRGTLSADQETAVPASSRVTFTSTISRLYYLKVTVAPAKFAGSTITLGNTLNMDFAIAKNTVPADGYVEFIKGDEAPVQKFLSECEADDNYYILTFPGIAAKEMGVTIKATVYDANGKAVSETITKSVQEYALNMLRGKKPANLTDEQFAELKVLLVDLLNYGSAAQTYFDYDTENLVNAGLTAEEQALATTDMKALTTEERAVIGEGYLGTSFVLESDIAMMIALDKNVAASYALVTFTNHYGEVVTQKHIDADDSYDTHTQFRFDGLAAADARYNVTWEIYTAEGAEPVVTVTDSLEKYIARSIAKYAWMEQIMIYADSAYDYLHFGETVA